MLKTIGIILLCLLIGYFCGTFQTGYIIGRIKHIDIRKYGSGNIGMTNVMRTLGKGLGYATFAGDIIKVLIASYITYFIYYFNYHNSQPNHIVLVILITGLGCVLGHNFPFYLKFKGGKGISSSVAVIFMLAITPGVYDWKFIVMAIITFFTAMFITKYVSFGSLCMMLGFFVEIIIWGQMGMIHTMPDSDRVYVYITVFIIALLSFVRHKGNIIRILNGTERKIGKNNKKNKEELIMQKVTVLGGGGWAIALAKVLSENNHDVTIWSAVDREVDALKNDRENKVSLPGIIIPENIKITNDLGEAVKDVDVIIMAVASSFVRSTSKLLKGKIQDKQIIVDVAKGIEDETFYTMTEIIGEELPESNPVVLSGPSHAEEVGRGIPTSVVIGAKDKDTAKFVQQLFANDYFRTYISPDMKSIELGGALKNIIALAAGVIDGLGFGDNTEAALITRGIKEITRLGVEMGGHRRTFYGLSGMGDLIVTCGSKHSRNRRAGELIGKGYTLDEAIKEVNMVVEGAVSAKAAMSLVKKYNVEAPIIEAVNKVLFENISAKDITKELMNRKLTYEYSDMDWE